MNDSHLKIVNISSKTFKKELLVSSKDAKTFHDFLKDVIKSELMVINTNIGLDIYYNDKSDHEHFIVNTFLLLAACRGKSRDHFFIQSFNEGKAIKVETYRFFEKLLKNPLLFKSYSKSLCNQLNANYQSNSHIINELMGLWQEALLHIDTAQSLTRTIICNFSKLEDSLLEKASKPLLQKLINESLSESRIN